MFFDLYVQSLRFGPLLQELQCTPSPSESISSTVDTKLAICLAGLRQLYCMRGALHGVQFTTRVRSLEYPKGLY